MVRSFEKLARWRSLREIVRWLTNISICSEILRMRALAEGEQLLTLRKGGIREPSKHFALEHDRFFLYPTFDHQRNDLVRESHQPELRRALEEGVWADGEPPTHALIRDDGLSQPDRVRIRAWAEVAR